MEVLLGADEKTGQALNLGKVNAQLLEDDDSSKVSAGKLPKDDQNIHHQVTNAIFSEIQVKYDEMHQFCQTVSKSIYFR